VIKRLFDLLLALVVAAILVAPMLIVAVAVRLTPWPGTVLVRPDWAAQPYLQNAQIP